MTELAHPELALQHCSPPIPTTHIQRQRTLVVGALDIPAKEQLVLRSLLRVMDGKNNVALRFSEVLSDCNVMLVPADTPSRLSPTCVTVQLIPEHATPASASRTGLSIRSPLRLSNTGVVLQAAAELLQHDEEPAPTSSSLAPLLSTLLKHIMAKERRTTVFSLGADRDIIVNFTGECYYSQVPLAELLQGSYTVNEPRRATEDEIASLAGKESRRLRELLWLATNKLVDSAEPGIALSGHFRLRRWPDAVALTRPGFPMLAALLTSRSCTIEQACQASGASVGAISWFLRTNLALGIAESHETTQPAKPASPPVSPATPAQSMLGRIRDRLKLW
jgi:hypothetical protein